MRRAGFLFFLFAWLIVPAGAQTPLAENIQIGLSTDRIMITSDFSGADLTIFGAVDNADPLVSRQGGYDVIVVLEGPAEPVVVWKRSRILGVWVNSQSETFVNIPISYSVSTTRVFQDITTPTAIDSFRLARRTSTWSRRNAPIRRRRSPNSRRRCASASLPRGSIVSA